jgi:hypothetical protein
MVVVTIILPPCYTAASNRNVCSPVFHSRPGGPEPSGTSPASGRFLRGWWHFWLASCAEPVIRMPQSGMEVPADAEYSFPGEWRRDPAQPVTVLTGSASPSCCPVRHKPAKNDTEASVRCRSGHDKAKPQSGRISALAGHQGRLQACCFSPSSGRTEGD